MRAGDLNEKIHIRYDGVGPGNEFGMTSNAHTINDYSTWAKVTGLGTSASGAGEFEVEGSMVNEFRAEFVTRYLTGLHPEMAISWNGMIFDIYSIIPIGRREGMRIRGVARGRRDTNSTPGIQFNDTQY